MDADFNDKREVKHPLCIDHHEQLSDIWVILKGNGHVENGIQWKIAKMEDRQVEILSFVKQVQGVFWKALPIALGGAVSAIGLFAWQVVKLLFEHGVI